PRGLSEAWFTCGGGLLMLLFGLETPSQALGMVDQGKDALFFLAGLLLLAELMRVSGFFEWAAVHAARSAKGDGAKLYRNVFLLGAAVTALLSLDTTAVMLTPVVLAFVGRLELKAKPFLFACAFIANTGSLLLQVSNLTNLLFAPRGVTVLELFTAAYVNQCYWSISRSIPDAHYEYLVDGDVDRYGPGSPMNAILADIEIDPARVAATVDRLLAERHGA
ncbi:MAG: DUF563 domain-containing protein, partial [Actinomycetales bacterium]